MEKNIDYFNNFISYVKIIMNNVDEKGSHENLIIEDIYNRFFNSKDDANNYMTEMIIVTALFENRLYALSMEERNTLINSLYDGYIRPIVCNYSNGSQSACLVLFHVMNEKVKALTGYNALYNNGFVSLNTAAALENKRGM